VHQHYLITKRSLRLIKLKHIVNGIVVSEIDIKEGDFTVGRAQGNDLQLEDSVVSSQHARFNIQRSPYMDAIFDITLEDLGSTNGTYVNGKKITHKRLNHSDQIRIGTHEFKIFDAKAGIGTQTEFYVPDE